MIEGPEAQPLQAISRNKAASCNESHQGKVKVDLICVAWFQKESSGLF